MMAAHYLFHQFDYINMYGNGIALVTGAAGGLGRATAIMLANRGFKVAFTDMLFCDHPVPREIPSSLNSPENSIFLGMNVTSTDSIDSAFEETASRFGASPSVVVHCAGVTACHALFDDKKKMHPYSLFTRIMDINANGTFNVARLAASHMLSNTPKEGERGVIITTSSITGFEGGSKQIAYSTSKAAVIGMTLPFARALGEYSIRFNSISPGMFYTPMLQGYEEVVDAMTQMVPFPKRLGYPNDFTKAVEFIIDCSMVNGAVLRVDGGMRM